MKCGNKFYLLLLYVVWCSLLVLNVWYHRKETLRLKVYMYIYINNKQKGGWKLFASWYLQNNNILKLKYV